MKRTIYESVQELSSVQTLKSLKLIPLKSLRIHWWMSFSVNKRHRLLLHVWDSYKPCMSQNLSSVQTLKSLKQFHWQTLSIHWWMSFSLNDRRGLLLQVRDSWSSLWLKFREFRLCHNQNIFLLNPYILERTRSSTNMVLATARTVSIVIHRFYIFSRLG